MNRLSTLSGSMTEKIWPPMLKCTMPLNAASVGLKDGPTRSRAARRPPTRSRVPWTRQTSPPSGRNQPSMSRIPLAPPRTAGAWSSAPGGESGRTLGGEQQRQAPIIKKRANAFILRRSRCPLLPSGCLSRRRRRRHHSRRRRRLVTGTNTYTSPVAPHFSPWCTSSPSSHAGPDGPVAAHERRRLGRCPDASPTG